MRLLIVALYVALGYGATVLLCDAIRWAWIKLFGRID